MRCGWWPGQSETGAPVYSPRLGKALRKANRPSDARLVWMIGIVFGYWVGFRKMPQWFLYLICEANRSVRKEKDAHLINMRPQPARVPGAPELGGLLTIYNGFDTSEMVHWLWLHLFEQLLVAAGQGGSECSLRRLSRLCFSLLSFQQMMCKSKCFTIYFYSFSLNYFMEQIKCIVRKVP